jgi:hypothetical protein
MLSAKRCDSTAIFCLFHRHPDVGICHVDRTIRPWGPNSRNLGLWLRYREHGNDVRCFAFIRDPRDTITSQYELWRHQVPGDSPARHERQCLEKYRNLAAFPQRLSPLPPFRYDEFAADPARFTTTAARAFWPRRPPC